VDITSPDGAPMSNRREFLRIAATATATAFGVGCSRAHAQDRGAGPGAGAPATEQQRAFRGTRAGETRVVEGVALQWCPAGRFVMGSPPGEAGRRPDEAQVEVRLARGFWTAKHETTQGEWKRIVGAFPDRPPTPQFGEGDDFPLYWVNFHEAERFCAALAERARRAAALPEGWTFTLPTEAQWEYACRAGTVTAMSYGDVPDHGKANFGEERDRRTPPTGRSRAVGGYAANAWGIHDMHGNVWEWCRDWYHARLPGGTDPDLYDVPGVMNGDGTYSRVRRGGAWIEPAWACRSACRLRYESPRRSDHIGMRIVAVERGAGGPR
jgi:formylglycine-generating enzyme required for sulfatase activity